jgi:hypothetical protein
MPKAALMSSLPRSERKSSMRAPSPREAARGQILVIAVLALVAIVGMVGLVIDGGALFAQQRIAQNGADGASTAGTVVIAEYMGGATTRGNQDVYDAIEASALANGLAGWTAEYTDDFGVPLGGVNVTDSGGPIPAGAEGVRATGTRTVSTTFSRILGFDQIPATAEATVVAGPLSGECVAEDDGCSVLPLTFPVQISQCDAAGELIEGPWIGAPPPGADPGALYWPIVGAESLPGGTYPDGDTSKMAILPLCRSASGGSGAFGWLDLDPSPGVSLPDEIEGPLNVPIYLPDWFQTTTGNPNSVDDELSAYIRKPVLIPLNNGACRVDPGATAICPAGQAGVDPVGNNTWYYVHTLAVFYIEQVLVQASNVDQCASAPGGPPVPVTTGGGFLGCLKGWFVNYVTAGPIIPGQTIVPGTTAIGIQLIK